MGKPNKLNNLEITSVSFVDEGANPDADILLYKSKDGAPAQSKVDELPPKRGNLLKRLFVSVAKAIGADGTETAAAVEEITKGAVESEEQVVDAVEKHQDQPPAEDGEISTTGPVEKGADAEMNIDKSKLTPAELSFLEDLEKRCGGDGKKKKGDTEEKTPEKKLDVDKKTPESNESMPEDGGDIYKNLHPAIRKELEDLRKRADVMEERELAEVAKRYEILGKNAAELVPVFKSLKAAGGDAYDQMISVLDANLEAVEKSGMFQEIGRSGAGWETNDAWSSIEKHADEIIKAVPDMNRAVAIEKACEQHPELVHEYEAGR